MKRTPRMLALRLACLSDTDQDWLLARLQPLQARRLRVLLDDLRRQGLLADRGRLRDIVAALPALPALSEGARLRHLPSPAWRFLAWRAMAPQDRPSPDALDLGSEETQRQVEAAVLARGLPEGWRQALLADTPVGES